MGYETRSKAAKQPVQDTQAAGTSSGEPILIRTPEAHHQQEASAEEIGGALLVASDVPLQTMVPHARTQTASGSRSSVYSANTVKAKVLAAEALHARRLADIAAYEENMQRELVQRQEKLLQEQIHRQQVRKNLEQKAAELDLQSQLAAIEVESNRSSSRRSIHSYHRNNNDVEMWLQNNNESVPNHIKMNNLCVQVEVPTIDCADHTRAYVATEAVTTVTSVPPAVTSLLPEAPVPSGTLRGATPVGATTEPVAYAVTAAPGAGQLPGSLPFNALPTYTPVRLGTLSSQNNCNINNKINNGGQATHSRQNDFRYLAEVIAGLNVDKKNKHQVSDLKIPIFDGRVLDWVPFKRTYEQTKSAFTPSENLARLSYALRGAARDHAGAFLASCEDPDDIVRALELRFARPEQIVLNELAQVRALPKLSTIEGGKDLCQFACRVRRCVETIRSLNQQEYLASPELSNTIVGKMSSLLRARWADYAMQHHSGSRFRLELIADFLNREAEIHTKFGFISDSILQRDSVKPTDRNPSKFKTIDRVHACTGADEQKDRSHSDDSDDDTNSSAEDCYATSTRQNFSKAKATPPTVKSLNHKLPCGFCQKGFHEIVKCDKFLMLTLNQRWQWVLENKVCRKCLVKGAHQYKFCKIKCDVQNCKYSRSHNTLLHGQSQAKYLADVSEQSVTESRMEARSLDSKAATREAEIVAHHSSQEPRPLLKIIAVSLIGPKGTLETYALLDDGSTASLIDSQVAEKIGAAGPSGHIRVNCIGGLSKESAVNFVSLKIKGRHNSDIHEITNVRAMPNLGISHQSASVDVISRYSHLSDLADELCYEDAKPTIIIGADNWHLTIAHSIRKGTRSQPVATLTALGWVLYGFTSSKTNPVQFVNHLADDTSFSEQESLEALIKENYKIDSIGIIKKDYRTNEQQRALKLLEDTTSRLPSGRFQTGLLWRQNICHVPNSFNLALSRFNSLERKFARDPAYADSYRQNVQAMLAKGYAEPCHEPPNPAGITWYLPHFGVVHPQKLKLRIVHDAAARCEGVSFNSLLLSGPDLLENLVAILMRFREGCVALNADIREMFPQVKIREEDRDAQRFLWRDKPSAAQSSSSALSLPPSIQHYRMTSMIFGATSSPCTALYLKNKNALEVRNQYPEAVHAIVENHYMDDYLGSVDTIDEAARLAADIVKVHQRACFDMRSWISNKPGALSLLPFDLHAKTSHVGLGSSSASNPSNHVKILGLSWNTLEDNLHFRTGLPETLPMPLSKRKALSLLMKVYDPLGFLCPIVIQGRIIFQELWRTGISWDEKLSPELSLKWSSWFADLSKLTTGSITRWYQTLHEGKPLTRELHVFADASEHAYVCVAYWRLTFANKEVELSLIGGKARLAPIKPVSIPRLELQAALIAARLANFIADSHKHKPDQIYFWSDSMTVLRWLRSDARTFKPFVAHRVGEITEITDISRWRYVPTSSNVADDATRHNHISFDTSARWFTGPPFLLSPPHLWPCEPCENVLLPPEELKRSPQITQELVGQINEHPPQSLLSPVVAEPSRFSEWIRLVRSTARVQQFVDIVRSRFGNKQPNSKLMQRNDTSFARKFPPLNADLLKAAERRLLSRAQIDSFPEELKSIAGSTPMPKESRLKNLELVLGERGLLRLSGRICRVKNTSQEVNPVVLDGRHPIVRMLIRHYHKKAAHANNELVVNELRRSYHIVGLRPNVKTVAKACNFCRIRKALPITPLLGDLPEARLAHHEKPFTHVGVDYFGPVSVTLGRRTEKKYVALFTCMTVRAVHIEIVGSLSTDAAIMALRRFIARRGCPAKIYSDNGTAFVGAKNKLDELYDSKIQDFVANRGIQWQFIPPGSPFMGGCWERLVRSIKTAITVTLKQRSPTEEVLHTFLLEAESLVNSRPLTHVTVNPGEEQALTPFHFILGRASTEPPLRQLTDADLSCRTNWKKGLRLADHFWRRWVEDYLPTLVPRQKVRSTTESPIRQIAVGDLVLVADGSLPRGTWPRGRVEAVWPGRDGVVRVADVTTKGGTLRRPVRKLAVLDLK